jgi:hypothetical protein
MPGDYRVTLVVNNKDIATKSVRVVGDTAIKWTDADRKTWHDTALAFHRLQEQANEAAEAVTQLGTQYQTLETLLKSATNLPGDAKTAIEAAGKELASLRTRLGVPAPGQQPPAGGGFGGGGSGGGPNPNVRAQLGQTKGQLMGAHAVPSEQQLRALTLGREDLTRVIADTNTLITSIPALFDKAGASAFKPAALKPVRQVTTN